MTHDGRHDLHRRLCFGFRLPSSSDITEIDRWSTYIGDVVQICAYLDNAKALQKGHGERAPAMQRVSFSCFVEIYFFFLAEPEPTNSIDAGPEPTFRGKFEPAYPC